MGTLVFADFTKGGEKYFKKRQRTFAQKVLVYHVHDIYIKGLG